LSRPHEIVSLIHGKCFATCPSVESQFENSLSVPGINIQPSLYQMLLSRHTIHSRLNWFSYFCGLVECFWLCMIRVSDLWSARSASRLSCFWHIIITLFMVTLNKTRPILLLRRIKNNSGMWSTDLLGPSDGHRVPLATNFRVCVPVEPAPLCEIQPFLWCPCPIPTRCSQRRLWFVTGG
jgi:hypothetical protein